MREREGGGGPKPKNPITMSGNDVLTRFLSEFRVCVFIPAPP